MVRAAILLGLLGLPLLPERALAHDFWIEPAIYRPAVGAKVPIHLRVGERLEGELVPRNPYAIVRFDTVDPAGVITPAPGEAGVDPAATVVAAAPGLHWIVYQSHPTEIELAPEKFDEHLLLEGLEAIVAERKRRKESETPGREAFSRSAKAALCAGDAASSGADLKPRGLALELVPASNPCTWRAGGEFELRLLFDGKPLEGALVQALRRDRIDLPSAADAPVRARTDREGRVKLKLGRPGFWLIKAVQMTRAEANPDVDWESFWASLTFELPATR